MKKVSLFEHNEKAYVKLNSALQNNKCATINHATGTGKSFIALKYLYENKNKKFLYIAPTYHILDQIKNDCYKIGIDPKEMNFDTMIYRNLLNCNMEDLYSKYDGIIFDEYHRCGARKTYKKMKQLKFLLDNDEKDKKFIGLTATPVRYLDNERNMTDEIFDGIVASRITLAEAMLDGLLPVPKYINSKVACREKLTKTRKKVNRLAPSKEKERLSKSVTDVEAEINNGAEDIKRLIKKNVQEKDGKYIVFCNTIEELNDYYKHSDIWFAHLGKINKYSVHSKKIEEDNKKQLKEFNDNKEGISLLFCVDVLNEGVHVDGVDGVFLMRKTISPIIYFQQIGRALSFGARDKQIKIFDLVNNFERHDAIYEVYRELKEEIKKRLKNNPDDKKKDKYLEILRKFVIMDETKEISDKLKGIENEVTDEKVINSKIEYSINILMENSDTNELNTKLISDKEIKDAYKTIAYYYKYVTNSDFEKLTSLNIILPVGLNISKEKRMEQLQGYQSFFEREKNLNKISIKDTIDYININAERPRIDSDDDYIKTLAEKYLTSLIDIDEDTKEILKETLKRNNIKLEPWEKLIFEEKININDLKEIVNKANEFISRNEKLPTYIYISLHMISIKYNTRMHPEIFELMEKSDNIKKDERKKVGTLEEERLQRINELISYLEKGISKREDEVINDEFMEKMKELKMSDREYIKNKYASMKKKYYKKMIHNIEDATIEDFCKSMKDIENKEIDEYFLKLHNDKKMRENIIEIINFMKDNNGKIPDENSEVEFERYLAKELKGYISSGTIESYFNDLTGDFQSLWYDSRELIYQMTSEKLEEVQRKILILRRIEFLKLKLRNPLKNSPDEEERQLAIDYEDKCVPNLDSKNTLYLNNIFNQKRYLENTCIEYAKNLASNSGEGR